MRPGEDEDVNVSDVELKNKLKGVLNNVAFVPLTAVTSAKRAGGGEKVSPCTGNKWERNVLASEWAGGRVAVRGSREHHLSIWGGIHSLAKGNAI